ncbi:hypothetical protein Tsubulata_049204 [Turnera subulata]|uniref:EamA domain-containing protein n=1 Tax=Turnera subulata TaxID=218843 RepID=A0A9Q0GDN1_9ROSI|nr:hypothetical protein Tsubulata_049204 [Turnera subulata]
MACPSTSTWRATARATATTRKSSASSMPSYLFYFSTIHSPRRYKRSLCITLSFEPAASSSHSSSNFPAQVKTDKGSLKGGETLDGSLSAVNSDEPVISNGKEDVKPLVTTNAKRDSAKTKKRNFWRKVFASKKVKSVVLLNLITVVYASNIPVVKAAETMMDPAAFSAMRFVTSAIPFLPFVFRARDDVQTRNAGIELGFWISLGYLIEALGLLTSDAGRASFISLFTVIVVPLLDGMLGAIIPARTWFGVLMSALGIAMLECSGSPPTVGDLLNFLSAIFFGIHMLRTEHFSRSIKKENFLSLLGYEVCVVAVLSTIWLLVGGWFQDVQELDQSSWTWPVLWDWFVAFPWVPALYTGVFSTGLCLWVEIAAMRDVTATETAIIYGLEPLWGAAFAWFLLGERWGEAGWIGAALVLGGSLVVQIFGTSSPKLSLKAEAKHRKGDVLQVLDKQKLHNGLSTSPIVVTSRKNVTDLLK